MEARYVHGYSARESHRLTDQAGTRRTFTAMVEGVREQALVRGLMNEAEWTAAIRDLYRTAADGGTFCYTFFKAIGLRPDAPVNS